MSFITNQAVDCSDLFSIDVDMDDGFVALRILRHTSQEVPHDKLVHFGLASCKEVFNKTII